MRDWLRACEHFVGQPGVATSIVGPDKETCTIVIVTRLHPRIIFPIDVILAFARPRTKVHIFPMIHPSAHVYHKFDVIQSFPT